MKGFALAAERLPEFAEIREKLARGEGPLLATGLSQIHKVHAAWALADGPRLVITPDEPSATRMAEDMNRFFGEERAVVFPAREFAFREAEGASREAEFARLRVLESLAEGEPMVVVAGAEAALQRTLPPEAVRRHSFTLHTGEELPPETLVIRLLAAGYERRDQVDGVCQFSQRGGILDFFPPNAPDPYRVEFWGDEIDSISLFKTDTQRRVDGVDRVLVTPAREVLTGDPEEFAGKLETIAGKLRGKAAAPAKEHLLADAAKLRDGLSLTAVDKYLPVLYPRGCTLLDYLPEDAPLFLCEPGTVREELRSAVKLQTEDMKVLFDEGILFEGCDRYLYDYDRLAEEVQTRPSLLMDTFPRSIGEIPLKALYNLDAVQLAVWGGELSHLLEDLEAYTADGYTVCVLAGTERAGRALAGDLLDRGYRAGYAEDFSAFAPGRVYVLPGSLSAGFEYPGIKLAVITQGRVGAALKKRRKPKQKSDPIRSLADLTPGDYVVHATHGIGIFEGIIKREIHGVVKDYIKIRYAGTDTLFVPVTQLDLVSRYIGGSEDGAVRLNRLNSAEWSRTKARVKKAVADMADELIRLYAQRMQAKGYAFDPDNDWQREFEARFPYEETDDQLRCIDEIKHDMERPVPMDRLLCGDVGFGKTEVAIRAAFKCVMNSKQCAVLVPTTILAWQHYQTFLQRMEGYPVRIELLSRFRTPKQQEEILRDLKKGLVDIVIGTHRIIQKDVAFKDLGLAIVDEEQRFGVAHKERFKEMFSGVDVLNLSATPIPRTLNMAMSGIRDMSVIEEAPQDRHPVQTYVLEYDREILAAAIRRELRRGGQIFYLHNRVESIEACAHKVQEMAPEARITIAHGKMTEEQLSRVWQQLIDQEVDILVCTTIIETGVDVPNCNTLIIEDADRMGLSQLYQIRGRVGRSTRRAYAYFTFTRGKQLTEVAEKRLSAIREFTSFGSGFRIAMRDLEIRGAGNVLGAQQHGHMEAVGYEMYLRLLSEAISEQKGEPPARTSAECQVDINVGAHIPESYIRNLSQRIDIYKKIAAIQSKEDAFDVTDELIDRFGDPPRAVQGLIDVALVRGRAAALGIKEISQRENGVFFFPETFDLGLASTLAAALKGRVSVNAGQKPYFQVRPKAGQQPLEVIEEALAAMETYTPPAPVGAAG